jgi:hypothetical protein
MRFHWILANGEEAMPNATIVQLLATINEQGELQGRSLSQHVLLDHDSMRESLGGGLRSVHDCYSSSAL